ncbi:hypothetical protein ACF09E_33405 [Streptomyces sp. NPDC014891]|uniref:hypothetical protein n=1 Tax=Streptomyces sp. NPDC014891 TaxID=3364929 RepID=UPI003700AB98
MRSILLPKSLITAAAGGALLVAFGTQGASAATKAPAPAAKPVAPARTPAVYVPPRAVIVPPRVSEAEARFLEVADLIAQSCEPRVLRAEGRVAAAPARDTTMPVLVDPLPLHPAEQCAAQRHQLRIGKAFSGTETGTYARMRDRLTLLRYPEARIHRMPDFSGRPVVRLDLRVGSGNLALEVTDIGNSVMVRAFGAPEHVSVTEVRLKQEVDWPTS